jgi:hypothetical protein
MRYNAPLVNHPEDERKGHLGFVEQARNKDIVLGIAQLQEAVVEKVRRLSEKYPERFERLGGYRDEDLIWFYIVDVLQGIEDVSFGISYYPEKTEEYYRKVGVKSPVIVSVGLYTDRETWEEVRQREAFDWEGRYGLALSEVQEQLAGTFTEEEIDEMTFPGIVFSDDSGTHYFVNDSGDFAKVVSIPDYVAEGRADLEIGGHKINGIVSVQVPMMARDLVIMKNALEVVDERLDGQLQQEK